MMLPRRSRQQQQQQLVVAAAAALFFIILQTTTASALSGISQPPKKKYGGGAGVGRLVVVKEEQDPTQWNCHYDMVLCERLQGKSKQDSGLYVPDDDLPRLHLCQVLSLGPGREEENGRIAPMPKNIQVGDVVIAKNPWGIGPKDEETTDGRKLSFMRSQDIAAVITGGSGLID